MPEFIYQFGPGDRPELATDLEAWTPQDEAVASAHYAYLEAALESGSLILAGRAQDGVGPAIVVIEAETAEDATRFMNDDPFVAQGLFTASIHPYRVALWREPKRG